jgi:hypothetical protein
MAMIVDNVIAGIKSRSIFTTNQITIDTDQLLSFLNSIIQLDMVSLVDSTNQEFFVRTVDVPIVAGQSRYRIPYRSMCRTLRDLKFHDTDSSNERFQNMILIDPDDLDFYRVGYKNYAGFYFKGDSVIIVPDVPSVVSDTAALQMWYKLKPNTPCLLENSAIVVSVNDPDVTVSQVPSNLSTGSLVDFIQGREGCDIYEFDKAITNISGTTLTFAADTIPDELQAGDYISLAQTSPVINMLPEECQPLIENKTAKLLLASIGDMAGSTQFDGWISDMEEMIQKMIEPRTDGNPQVIMNRYSLARGRRYWYGLYGGGVITP